LSYVGGPFSNDIFVSYAHGDALRDGKSQLRRWSEGFAEQLRYELQTIPRIGSALRLFLDTSDRPDQGVDPFAPLTEGLKAEIGASALAVVLLSPHYLGSHWCKNERLWWQESGAIHGIPCQGRLALTRAWPVEEKAELPSLFTDSERNPLPGFWFHARGRPERPQPFGWVVPGPETGDPFREALLTLVNHVAPKLDKLKEAIERRQREQSEAARFATGSQVVYLHAREDDHQRWAAASEDLRNNDFIVFPTEPDRIERDPAEDNKRRIERVRALSGCDALLLLAPPRTDALDADLLAVGRWDRNSARAITNRLLPSAVLDTVGAPVLTPNRGQAASLQVDWIDATTKPFAPSVKKWLASKSDGAAVGGK
jgi:hypothetical protein